jgi:hypothetical protein
VSGQVDGVFGHYVSSLWRRAVPFSSLHRRVRVQSGLSLMPRFPNLMRTAAGAQCIFNPSAPVTPGNSAIDMVMNISTSGTSVRSETPVRGNLPPPAMWLPVAAIVIGMSASGHRTAKPRQLLGCVVFCLMMMGLVSCAGVGNGGGGAGQRPPPATYYITVTGTSSGTPSDAGQSTTVTLVVN